MDVTIKYLPNESFPCGQVVRFKTPPKKDVEECRAAFCEPDPKGDKGIWALEIDVSGKNERGEWDWVPCGTLLEQDAASGAEYLGKLDEYVAYVTIDGMTYWANSTLGGGEE